MHTALELLLYWGLSFLTLCAALTLLNIFDAVIGNDLVLLPLRQEAWLAGFAALIEGACFWSVLTFVPAAASRALIVPLIIVGGLYQIAHLTDWARFDAILLMLFQLVLGFFLGALFRGQFMTAFTVLLAFSALLALVASFARSLGP